MNAIDHCYVDVCLTQVVLAKLMGLPKANHTWLQQPVAGMG